MTADPQRRYEFDWLRISATLVVFFYHSTRFFNIGDWHIKNANTYVWVEILNVFINQWMMPLFFIISGAGLFYAIRKSRGWRQIYVDKFMRLMVPVLLGSVTFGILQVYLERLTHGRFSGGIVSFLPRYFNGVYLGFGSSGNFAFSGMHLWYLLFLFVYSMLFYPLFIWLAGKGRGVLNRVVSLFTLPGGMYVGLSIPLLVLNAVVPQAVLDVGSGGWGFLYYIWFLISGFIIVSNDGLQQHIMQQRWISLLLGIGCSCAYLFQLFSPSHFDLFPWLVPFLSYISAWSWLLAILGFSMIYFTGNRPFLKTVNTGVLPFYILHQTVLLCVGYYVMTLNINDPIKWLMVSLISFIVILCGIFLIRKFELLRFLFGMKTTRPFFGVFRKGGVMLLLHGVYVALIVFAVYYASQSRSPMPLQYDPNQDVVLNGKSIAIQSADGVHVVDDQEASIGKAIVFFSGAHPHPEAQPDVYIDMTFSAPEGRYFVWIRGKADIDDGNTDSVWVQVDDQIGNPGKSARMGNWLDAHPAGVYGWAGDVDSPVTLVLKHTGMHTIRIQPRQIPHRIDQVWLSRLQERIPDTLQSIER